MTRKRLIFIVITAAVLLLAAVLILIRLQPAPPRVEDMIPTLPGPTPAALTARMNEIQGSVTARRAGEAQFAPVSPGLVLNVSSAVKTGEQSKVRLDLSNQSIVRLGENTIFVFNGEVKASDGYHYLINLGIGELWIILRDGQLEVQTPSGLAAVRGSFLHVVYYPEDQSTQITCLEGNCNLKNASGKVDLVAGQTAIVYNVDVPPVTGRMNNHDVTQWLVNNPEATLVIPQLQATSAALPVVTPGASGTPPPTQAATELAIFEATLAATYETPVLSTLLPSGTAVLVTPSSAPTASAMPTLQPTSTTRPSATKQPTVWIPLVVTATQIPPVVHPTSTAKPTETATPDLTQTNQAPFVGCSTVFGIPPAECDALVAFYNSTNGSGWINKTGWLSTNGACSWYGITCYGGHIDRIFLLNNNLSGNIPIVLTHLPNLTELSLGGNHLSGSIPPELGRMIQLEWLEISLNQLSGSIPPEIGNLVQLQSLYFSDNQLNGSIPPQLGNLTHLTLLSLEHNQLSGSIPTQLGNLVNINRLYLDDNQLNGSIPTSLGNMTHLWSLYLFKNQLSGSIPPEISHMAALSQLDLNDNQLTGSIPPEIGNMANLEDLQLFNNQLSGSIPPEIGHLAKVSQLVLQNNQLSGTLPVEIGNMTNLRALILSTNALSGPIPASITHLSKLAIIRTGGGTNTLDSLTTDTTTRSFLSSKFADWTLP